MRISSLVFVDGIRILCLHKFKAKFNKYCQLLNMETDKSFGVSLFTEQDSLLGKFSVSGTVT